MGEITGARGGSGRRPSGERERALLAARRVGEWLKRSRLFAPLVTAVARRLVRSELCRLHDVLSTTPIGDRCWMSFGALLGWAREGRILAHDTADIDLAYLAGDTERLVASVGALERAGFAVRRVLRRHDGRITGVVFERSGIHFDFLAAFPEGDDWQIYSYLEGVQIVEEVPAQELERFELCGRAWLKVKDHERELTRLYGEWRVPRPDWDTARDSPAVVARAPVQRRAGDPRDLSDRH